VNRLAAARGTHDVLPSQAADWNRLETRAREIAERFGYGEIRTPSFELTDLFVRGVGDTTDIVEKEMYAVVTKGEREARCGSFTWARSTVTRSRKRAGTARHTSSGSSASAFQVLRPTLR
jgi:hypothetical protein